ncbi:MAG: CopG family transcriptional regulator [SAR324 cluster bacterium]|nr:CopG family transcriptional regulator [SAR324 cluster bacterium]
MIALRLDSTIEAQISALAVAKGKTKSSIVRDAILRMLEDEEDLALVEKATSQQKTTKSLAELRKELGLEN